jgi:hypothetical protein
MIRRLLVYSLLAAVIYYGYETLQRASSIAPDLRHSAAPANEDSGPIGNAVERRRAEERAVQDASARSPEEQRSQ